MNHWQKKELFHVKHYPKPLVFLHPREDRRSDPESRNRDNAECAPETLPEAAGLVLRTGSAARRRPREVDAMFSPVMSESFKTREESEPVFDTSPRVPSIPA